MLPMRFFRNRTFTAANVASLFMFFGMFGSIFLLAQYFQTVQGSSPLQSGLRILPWTAMPIFIAPIAGLLSDKIGGRPIMAAGLALQACRARLDRSHPDDDAPLLEHRHPVRSLRHRDGDVLRARRQRRPLLGQAGGRGPGIGRQQRDPRARRRLRRRRAGLGLLPLRRLPDTRTASSTASPQRSTSAPRSCLAAPALPCSSRGGARPKRRRSHPSQRGSSRSWSLRPEATTSLPTWSSTRVPDRVECRRQCARTLESCATRSPASRARFSLSVQRGVTLEAWSGWRKDARASRLELL